MSAPVPELSITRLAACRVQDVDGGLVELGSLWRDSPALLLFLRHFG